MSTLQSVQEAQQDLDQLQVAIGAVSSGLDAVETAIEVADTARRGFRRLLGIAVVVGAIVAIALIVRRMGDDGDMTSDVIDGR